MSNVPQWSQLPPSAQKDLARWKAWYAGNNDNGRLTLLNVYLKLKQSSLWRHVKGPSTKRTGPGNIELLATNVNALKADLDRRNNFVGPDKSSDAWSAREHKVLGALHFKHNKEWGHALDEVQVHIDAFGLTAAPLLHWQTEEDYQYPKRIRNILSQQGYDRSVLFGKPGVSLQRITVPTINITGRKPLRKLRKIQPAVPPGIIPGEDIGEILKRWRLAEARKYVPPLKPHVAGVPPMFQHNAKRWKIPRGQTNPFPSEVSKLSMGQRQTWLRQYYQVNPRAALQAREEAKAIIRHADTYLGSRSASATHYGRHRQMPVRQTNPFPSEVSKFPTGQRQAWLRQYYQVNPRAALQARSEARTIMRLARTHLK